MRLKDLLSEVAQQYTRDDDLPGDLLLGDEALRRCLEARLQPASHLPNAGLLELARAHERPPVELVTQLDDLVDDA